MIHYYVSNPITNAQLSNDNFNKFSTTHIERLKVNIPETTNMIYGVPVATIFNSMISDTELKFNAWKASIDTGATEKAEKEGKTIDVNSSFKNFKSFISLKAGVIADKYHKNPAIFEEFYPQGAEEYSKASKAKADKIFKRFITALDKNKADFDAAVLTEANAMYDVYTTLRKVQLQKIGKVKDESSTASVQRDELSLQLYKNLLTLLLINADMPEKTAIYFDESMFKKKTTQTPPVQNQAAAN